MSITRRRFLAGGTGAPALLASVPVNHMRVGDILFAYEDYCYRTPMKFGGNVVERVTG